MSRYMHQVEITQEQLSAAWRRARIAGVVIFVGFFTIFVAFAPDAPKIEAAPAMAAVTTP